MTTKSPVIVAGHDFDADDWSKKVAHDLCDGLDDAIRRALRPLDYIAVAAATYTAVTAWYVAACSFEMWWLW